MQLSYDCNFPKRYGLGAGFSHATSSSRGRNLILHRVGARLLDRASYHLASFPAMASVDAGQPSHHAFLLGIAEAGFYPVVHPLPSMVPDPRRGKIPLFDTPCRVACDLRACRLDLSASRGHGGGRHWFFLEGTSFAVVFWWCLPSAGSPALALTRSEKTRGRHHDANRRPPDTAQRVSTARIWLLRPSTSHDRGSNRRFLVPPYPPGRVSEGSRWESRQPLAAAALTMIWFRAVRPVGANALHCRDRRLGASACYPGDLSATHGVDDRPDPGFDAHDHPAAVWSLRLRSLAVRCGCRSP